jgi:excisionase family DNA binding protein
MQLLSLAEAAEMLRLTTKQLYALTREQSQCRRKFRLPVIHIGRRCLFNRESLETWIRQLEGGAQ